MSGFEDDMEKAGDKYFAKVRARPDGWLANFRKKLYEAANSKQNKETK